MLGCHSLSQNDTLNIFSLIGTRGKQRERYSLYCDTDTMSVNLHHYFLPLQLIIEVALCLFRCSELCLQPGVETWRLVGWKRQTSFPRSGKLYSCRVFRHILMLPSVNGIRNNIHNPAPVFPFRRWPDDACYGRGSTYFSQSSSLRVSVLLVLCYEYCYHCSYHLWTCF